MLDQGLAQSMETREVHRQCKCLTRFLPWLHVVEGAAVEALPIDIWRVPLWMALAGRVDHHSAEKAGMLIWVDPLRTEVNPEKGSAVAAVADPCPK